MYSSIFDVITICTLRQNKCTQGKRAPLVKYENVVPEIMLYAPFLDGTLRPCIALLLACLINKGMIPSCCVSFRVIDQGTKLVHVIPANKRAYLSLPFRWTYADSCEQKRHGW